MASRHVLFIHGAGEGAYDEDALLAGALQEALGPGYQVHFPRMPNEAQPEYPVWRRQIEAALLKLDGPVDLVGHSVGGSMILKYLVDAASVAFVGGVFILAAPHWGADAFWSWEEGTLTLATAARLAGVAPLYLYHQRDDEVVPFSHLAANAALLPDAIVRAGARGGHQFGNDLGDVARDITGRTPLVPRSRQPTRS